MRFSKNIIRTFTDIPDKTTMLVNAFGCNLHCYKCFNYDELVGSPNPNNMCDDYEILKKIERNGDLFDAILFSGGEFLLSDMHYICDFITAVRSVFGGIVVVNTNGTFPHKIKALLDKQLVEGVDLDYKMPFDILTPEQDSEVFELIMGVKYSPKIIQDTMKSLDLVVQSDLPYSCVRTPRYPVVPDEYFEAIKKIVADKNAQYNSNVRYDLNEFLIV